MGYYERLRHDKIKGRGNFHMEQSFVIGDVHGCYEKLEKLLTYWNPDSEKLIFIGDLIDRGVRSREVVQLAMKLHKEYGAVVIGGNHEEMFLEWLDAPTNHFSFYYAVGGEETLHSFYDEESVQSTSPINLAKQLQQDFPEEVEFIKSLPDYVEFNHHIFVHAGINLGLRDWKNSGTKYFRSIREPFHTGKNKSGQTIVFGHTPTRRIYKNKKSDDIWIAPCKTKIGIDGAAVYGGLLHGLHIQGNGEYQLYSIENHKVSERSFSLAK